MSLLHLAGGGSSADDKLYVEDVFSTYLYTGNDSTQTINNGIDLAGKGGLVWTKGRTDTSYNVLTDTLRGGASRLRSNAIDVQDQFGNTSFLDSGFSLNSGGNGRNRSGIPYASWTFRRAAKFFDVVTWSGNGVAGRQIPHNLGCEVGMIIIKCLDIRSSWNTRHRSANGELYLNNKDAQLPSFYFITGMNASTFTLGSNGDVNGLGSTYVAYLFAHDPSADGIIQCGSFTQASGISSIDLGWEPQYVLAKASSSASNWIIFDIMRGAPVAGDSLALCPNLSRIETSEGTSVIYPTTTGFDIKNAIFGAGAQVIYIAIRRPMKVPTSGTQVYNAIARTGTSGAKITSGILTDAVIIRRRNTSSDFYVYDRLRGSGKDLKTNLPNTEAASYTMALDQQDGYVPASDVPINYTGTDSYVDHVFRRAPGFMDIVCYTGTGVARTINHNLGVVPELMIVKSRSNTSNWYVFHSITDVGYKECQLNTTTASGANTWTTWLTAKPTINTISLFSSGYNVNESAQTYVAYLFSSLNGISKVGSYTGNGTSQTIPCGFSTGSRFVLIKRTDSTGDWYIWDTARGIVAANDPYLSLNTTAAEVTTDDSIDPESSGFIVNQNTATNINVLNGTYIFLAIA